MALASAFRRRKPTLHPGFPRLLLFDLLDCLIDAVTDHLVVLVSFLCFYAVLEKDNVLLCRAHVRPILDLEDKADKEDQEDY